MLRESVIRRTSQLALDYDALNLGQGFPDERPQEAIRAALAVLAGTPEEAEKQQNLDKTISQIFADTEDVADRLNQYSDPRGTLELRKAIAEYYHRVHGLLVDPLTEVTVCLGATEAMSVTLRTIVGLGSPAEVKSVMFFSPSHEMYYNQATLFGLQCIYVPLSFEEKALEEEDSTNNDATATKRYVWRIPCDHILEEYFVQGKMQNAKAFIMNNPHNPTGTVFSEEDVNRVLRIAFKYGVKVITDDIYEHIVFKRREGRHFNSVAPIWRVPTAFEHRKKNVVLINAISKTACATGWRIGWAIADAETTAEIRAIHDTLTVQAPTPFQYAAARFLSHTPMLYFYDTLPELYKKRYKVLAAALRDLGFVFAVPEGAYYIYAKYDNVPKLKSAASSEEAALILIRDAKVAAVPEGGFLPIGAARQGFLRFAFCKKLVVMEQAAANLRAWAKGDPLPPAKDVDE